MIGELNEGQVDQLLHSQVVGRIGCHAGGRTYVVPTTYAYDGSYIYGHSSDGLKVRMMRDNPQVCFEVDRVENLANWQSVIVNGVFEELQGEPAAFAMGRIVDRLAPLVISMTSIPETWNGGGGGATGHNSSDGRRPGVVYRIRIVDKSGRFEKR